MPWPTQVVMACLRATAIAPAPEAAPPPAGVPSAIRSTDQLLRLARSQISPRVRSARGLADAFTRQALVVDSRPLEQRLRDGDLPGSIIVDRNVLEWRCDPRGRFRHPLARSFSEPLVVVCSEGFSSSLAAASLLTLGLFRATDLEGGYRAIVGEERKLGGGGGCGGGGGGCGGTFARATAGSLPAVSTFCYPTLAALPPPPSDDVEGAPRPCGASKRWCLGPASNEDEVCWRAGPAHDIIGVPPLALLDSPFSLLIVPFLDFASARELRATCLALRAAVAAHPWGRGGRGEGSGGGALYRLRPEAPAGAAAQLRRFAFPKMPNGGGS